MICEMEMDTENTQFTEDLHCYPPKRKAAQLATKALQDYCEKEITHPVWSKALREVREVDGKWIVGTTDSTEAAHDVIDAYCRSLPCDFVKSHPSDLEGRHQRKSEKSRILWQMKDIPSSGIPFSVMSRDVLKCTFSMNYSKSKKRRKSLVGSNLNIIKENEQESEIQTSNYSSFSNGAYDCPAKIIIKLIKRYLDYVLPVSAAKDTKIASLRSLKQEIENKSKIKTQDTVWVSLPLFHNHSFSGKDRLIHQSIRDKIKEFINQGIVSSDKLKLMLNQHVQDYYQYNDIPPSLNDQAYYPSLLSIKNVLYNYIDRKKNVSNESKMIRKKKNNINSPKDKKLKQNIDNKTTDHLGALNKPNTLEDVVQAFCSDSLGEANDDPSYSGNDDGSELSALGKTVRDKLIKLISLTYSVNDVSKLNEMSNNLNVILANVADNQQTLGIDLNTFCQPGNGAQYIHVDANHVEPSPDYVSVTQINELPLGIHATHLLYPPSKMSEFKTQFIF